MYVLVLGLDVLGNPFGLIRGLSEGMEAFFYEPFQVWLSVHFSILTHPAVVYIRVQCSENVHVVVSKTPCKDKYKEKEKKNPTFNRNIFTTQDKRAEF